MTKRKKKAIPKDFEAQCRSIVMDNFSNVEMWLERLGKSDPEAALRMWANLAEFVEAKKARDAKQAAITNINVRLVPATKRQGQLEPKLDEYIELPDTGEEESPK